MSSGYQHLDISKINMCKTRLHNCRLYSPNVPLLWFVQFSPAMGIHPCLLLSTTSNHSPVCVDFTSKISFTPPSPSPAILSYTLIISYQDLFSQRHTRLYTDIKWALLVAQDTNPSSATYQLHGQGYHFCYLTIYFWEMRTKEFPAQLVAASMSKQTQS